jgi:uncharacterized damage-inducible protein DinB
MDIQKELIAEFDLETDRTRKLLNAIPETADFTWKPHEKSMPLGRLASHVAEMSGDWAVMTLVQDRLDWDPSQKPAAATTKADLLEQFEASATKAKSALAGFDSANWEKHWIFAAGGQVFIDQPKYEVWRSFVMNHGAHHRGQLTVYLRLLGAKLPGCYGPSADEM